MQFWIGVLIGAMIGASVGLAVLAWLFASRRADDAASRARSSADALRQGQRRSHGARVIELPRSVALTSSDADSLRSAAEQLEAHGGSEAVAHHLRDIANRIQPADELQSLRKGS
jgi:gas vesicle protein